MDIADVIISEGKSMIQAMEVLDSTAKRVLFVEREGKLAAAITDGDIRRWILAKGSLDAKVRDIANYNPFFLHVSKLGIARDFMKKHSIEAVPLVDDEQRIESIIFLNEDDVKRHKQFNVPIVIMAGGLGTRLYPYTKILPKPLIPIGEIPIIEHIMNRFNQHGSDRFFLVVKYKKNMIKAYFNENSNPYTISYIDEDMPLGTGGGLSLLKGKIDSTFVLSNCDILIEEDYGRILKHHKEEQNLITMVCSLKNIKIPYGVIEITATGEIEDIREKPVLPFFVNTGMYVVEPEVIEELEPDTAINFPDIVDKYRYAGQKVGVYPISENSWLDMGQLDEMEEMRRRIEV